jgi:hypothetical protein
MLLDALGIEQAIRSGAFDKSGTPPGCLNVA